ncbi:histidine kinase [Leptolyngbya sp. NIES-2104]|uniref:histidine kinase n=1 Tax=Leptolyngbya sp. NIES-2104 TaxID=1552121 RepID=UPI0006EC548E|nr:histidine kinase [Leptolyngbya sp. NIES-2104]GAP98049.1 high-affnity carbon uptake protein Hat/HatR [Leptolyngbya sp. NIES-2104]
MSQLDQKMQCDSPSLEGVRQDRMTVLEQENALLRSQLQQAQASEARYRQIFENAPISIMFINAEGYVTEANQACEALFGATSEQLNVRSIFERPELVENGTLPYMLQAFTGKSVVEIPTCTDYTDDEGGILFFSQGHYAPIWDELGNVQEIVEIAPDVSALFEVRQALQKEQERAAQERANLLGTIAQVANLLLRSPDYTTVLPDVVRLLGEAVGSDRCVITQEMIDPTTQKHVVQFVTEHALIAIPSDLNNAEYQTVGVIDEDPAFVLRTQILRGEAVNFLVSELPHSLWKKIFEAQQCTSLLIVPIMVQGKCWGQIGFDNCREPQLFNDEEIAILRIAADSIAAAIERQRTQTAMLEEQLRSETAILEERNRIAREIHDTIAQGFTGILMQIQAVDRFLTTNPTQAKACLDHAQTLAKTGLLEARRAVFALYKDPNEDLFHRLTQAIHSVTTNTLLQTHLCLDGDPYPLTPDVSLNLCRIAQEAVMNALRHTEATQLDLTLRYECDRVCLKIHDNGQGFDVSQSSAGFGLMGMQQRGDLIGATLTLSSQLGQGTEINVVVPVPATQPSGGTVS